MNHHPTWKIIAKNTFTLFNFVNLILALMVALVGSYKNMLFIGIAIANTLISIINELRAKKIVDKLRLISEQKPTVLRDGKSYQIAPAEIKKGDVVILSLGDQILYDSIVQSGEIEVNESFITGEQDNITKKSGDHLTSGSFIVSGSAKVIVEHIGSDNFVTKLQSEASTIETADSKLFKLMNNIVKYISYALIPVGALLLWTRFRTEPNTTDAVTSTVAALINMIPEGLILLTSSVLAVATVRLGKRKVLVQDLYSIETLARVDCICLDKTGTLTTGKMTVHDALLPDGTPVNLKNPTTKAEKTLLNVLESILSYIPADNATSSALHTKFARGTKIKATEPNVEIIPFSSDRKYSGIKKGNNAYLMGAIDFLTDDVNLITTVKSHSGSSRTISVIKAELLPNSRSSGAWQGEDKRRSPVATGRADAGREWAKVSLLGLIRLEDEIRPTASKIIKYFYDNDISVKIISGDDLQAVSSIAKAVGVKNLEGIDLSTLTRPSYDKLVKEYSIFTRVKPDQKKELIKAFKKQGSTVAMTGDGVNDILAMKEADVSLAIGEGSDAARRASKLVLLNSDFESVPSIIDEGRQAINNLERSTALFLAKTVYASILAVIFVILPFSYPFSPIEMSLLNFACIGFPGLVLSFERNTDRIKNRFTRNIIEYSFPIGFTVSICMVILSALAHINEFTRPELTTASVFITFTIDLILIYWISRPLNKLRTGLLFTIIGIMAAAFGIPLIRDFFEFTFLTKNGFIIMLAIIGAGFLFFNLLRLFLKRSLNHILTRLHI